MEMGLVRAQSLQAPSADLTVLVIGPDQAEVGTVGVWARQAFGCGTHRETPERFKCINEAVSARFGVIGGRWLMSETDLSDTLPFAQAAELLESQRGAGRVAVLAGVELCALATFWNEVATRAGSQVAIVLIVSPPPVAGTTAELVNWFNLLLAAERSTRHLQRRVVRADGFDALGAWVASIGGLSDVAAVEHSNVGVEARPIPEIVPPGYNSWMRRCETAFEHLVRHGESEVSHRELDNIGASLDAALAIFSPLLNEGKIEAEKLRASNVRLRASLEYLDEKYAGVEQSLQIASLDLDAFKHGNSTHDAVQSDEQTDQLSEQLLGAQFKLGSATAANRRAEGALTAQIERQVATANKPLARWLQKRGWSYRTVRRMEQHTAIIENFLDELPWPIVGVHPEGRRRRIYAYLAGATDMLADFPLVQNPEYIEMYPDVLPSGMTPLIHFILHGQAEMRNPHPLFDTSYYTWQCPEAAHLAPSPVLHYLKWGCGKGYDPHPLFSTSGYWGRYPSVRAGERNPLLHWIENCLSTAHPLFDPHFYLAAYPDVADAGRNPLAHYLGIGWREGRNPNPWFDTRYYLANNPACAKAGIDPLIHYSQEGWRSHRAPGPAFDPVYYRANTPDLADDCDPLTHFIEHGPRRGHHAVRDVVDRLPQVGGTAEATAEWAMSGSIDTRRVVLMVDAFYPRPDQDSGSLDHINFVRIFQRMGYEVHYLALMEFDGDHDARSSHYRSALEKMGVHCVTSRDSTFIESYYFQESDRIAICFVSRAHFGGLQVETLQRLCPEAKIIFNTVDLHFVREEREGVLKNEPGLIRRSQQTRELEIGLAEKVDATIVVSSSEKVLLGELCPQANIVVVPLIREFSTQSERPLSGRNALAFVGGYEHQPNIDALEYFLEDIWPLIRQRKPDALFHVIGSKMPKAWTKRKIPGVEFVGFVEDLDAELASLRLTVAPLRYGAGAKGKLVSSLAAGVPAVVTSIAAEGMGLEHEETVLIADEAEAFADAVVRLYQDETLWTEMSAKGAAFIRKNYSVDEGFRLMGEVLAKLGVKQPSQAS